MRANKVSPLRNLEPELPLFLSLHVQTMDVSLTSPIVMKACCSAAATFSAGFTKRAVEAGTTCHPAGINPTLESVNRMFSWPGNR